MSMNIIAVKGYLPKYSFISSNIGCTFFIQYFLLFKNHEIHKKCCKLMHVSQLSLFFFFFEQFIILSVPADYMKLCTLVFHSETFGSTVMLYSELDSFSLVDLMYLVCLPQLKVASANLSHNLHRNISNTFHLD